jgi:tripartite-type tricarboxylate transporter receptor subunit TctC
METFRVLLTAVCLVAAFAAEAAAQSDPFFKGKQIKIVVGFTTGGIIDLWGRLYTQHLGKYIPGNPDLIAQNVAGGSLRQDDRRPGIPG